MGFATPPAKQLFMAVVVVVTEVAAAVLAVLRLTVIPIAATHRLQPVGAGVGKTIKAASCNPVVAVPVIGTAPITRSAPAKAVAGGGKIIAAALAVRPATANNPAQI